MAGWRTYRFFLKRQQKSLRIFSEITEEVALRKVVPSNPIGKVRAAITQCVWYYKESSEKFLRDFAEYFCSFYFYYLSCVSYGGGGDIFFPSAFLFHYCAFVGGEIIFLVVGDREQRFTLFLDLSSLVPLTF